MKKRLRILGIALVVVGLGFVTAGAVAYAKVQDGYGSLQAFSEAQNVTLNYNDDGQLIDRGTTEGADAIMALLTEDWNYPVVESDLDPNNPLVNTATEYMYQMATIVYHVQHGTETIVLDEAVEYEGEVFPAGSYDFEVDGRYWTGFDRQHPIEGAAREQAWSGTVHGLVGELGVGTVTHTTLQMGLAMAALFAAIGLTVLATGSGLIWASRKKDTVTPEELEIAEPLPEQIPDTLPESLLEEAKSEASLN